MFFRITQLLFGGLLVPGVSPMEDRWPESEAAKMESGLTKMDVHMQKRDFQRHISKRLRG